MRSIEKRAVLIDGLEVCYRIGGDASDRRRPVLLLIHGMAGSSATWREVMPALSRFCTVIAPDLLGHGDSAKPATEYSLEGYASGLRDLLSALRIERATIIGQSLGGGIAMQLAYQHPECCERLVLVGSGGLGEEVSWILRLLTLPGAERIMPLVFLGPVRDLGNLISLKLRDLGVHAPHAAEEWRGYVSLTDPDKRHAFARILNSVVGPGGQTVSAHDRLHLAAHIPTLIVWGHRDRIIPVAHAFAAKQALPGSHLEIFEHSGHFPHTEEPERFVEVLSNFLESAQPAHPVRTTVET